MRRQPPEDLGTKTVEYGGSVLEASGFYGTVYLTIDGKESKRQFPTVDHAIDFGKRRINSKLRAARPKHRLEVAPVEAHSFMACNDVECDHKACRDWWDTQFRVFGRTYETTA